MSLLAIVAVLVGGSAAVLVILRSWSTLLAELRTLPADRRRRGVLAGVGAATFIVLLVFAMIAAGPWALAAVGGVFLIAFLGLLPFIARSDIRRQRARRQGNE